MDETKRRVDEWIKNDNKLEELDLRDLGLTELPEIPYNCTWIDLRDNNLTKLPEVKSYETVFAMKNKYLYIKPYQAKTYFLQESNYLEHGKVCHFINYPKFATKIQQAYRKYKQKHVFNELHKLYIKNMAMLISQYT